MRLLQLPRALITADLNRLTADHDLDRIRIQLAVASSTSFINHDITPIPEDRVWLVGHTG